MPMAQELVTTAVPEPSPDPADLRVEIARTGVRQYLVAEKVGVSEGQLSRLLTGRKPLSAELAARIKSAIAEVAAA